MKKSLLILCFIVLTADLSNAQNTLKYLSSTTGAACFSIKYYNGYVFTGTGSTLRSYYVGNGATVPFDTVFEYRYTSQIMRLNIQDHYLYVAANYDGISKWDISNPAQPVKIFDILPDSADMAAQSIALKGDTIFVAQQKKVTAYRDYGTSYSKIASFGNAPFAGTVAGVAVKGNLLAYTVWQLGAQNGVYLYNANDFSFISFVKDGTGKFLLIKTNEALSSNILSVLHSIRIISGVRTVKRAFPKRITASGFATGLS